MTATEFDAYRSRSITDYATAHVEAGDWPPEGAELRAARETDELLPDGVETPGMLLVVAETERDGAIGMAWLAVESADRAGAWIYDIEIVRERRGEGHGRRLLQAVERLAAERGAATIGLNVFGGNSVACGLYESSGFEVSSLQMHKALRAAN